MAAEGNLLWKYVLPELNCLKEVTKQLPQGIPDPQKTRLLSMKLHQSHDHIVNLDLLY